MPYRWIKGEIKYDTIGPFANFNDALRCHPGIQPIPFREELQYCPLNDDKTIKTCRSCGKSYLAEDMWGNRTTNDWECIVCYDKISPKMSTRIDNRIYTPVAKKEELFALFKLKPPLTFIKKLRFLWGVIKKMWAGEMKVINGIPCIEWHHLQRETKIRDDYYMGTLSCNVEFT